MYAKVENFTNCHCGEQQYISYESVNAPTNNRGQKCHENNMTVCCPHMSINSKGEYMATNEMTPFPYKNKYYELHTCCKQCALQMIDMTESEFESLYKPIVKGDHILIHHRDTGEIVQKMKMMNDYKPIEQQYTKYNRTDSELEWEYKQPMKVYENIVERFGLPDSLAPQRGGIAIWNSVTGQYDPLYKSITVFDRHELRDELVAHACPAQHNDFLYSYIKIPIKPEQLEDVLKLSGSVNYDGLKKEIFARCANTCANVMTLFLATEIICSHISPGKHMNIQQIHKGNEYGKHINKTGDTKFMAETIEKLRSNISKIRSSQSLPLFHWPGAFGDNCSNPNN